MSYYGSIQRMSGSVGATAAESTASTTQLYQQAAKDYNTAAWLWVLVGAMIVGGIIWDYKRGASYIRRNPGRPPKGWMSDCMAGVGPSYDAGAVCGAQWYHKMSPAQKRAAVRRHEARKNPVPGPSCGCPFNLES